MKKLLEESISKVIFTIIVYLLISFILLEADFTQWGYFPRILLVASFLLGFRLEELVNHIEEIKKDKNSDNY